MNSQWTELEEMHLLLIDDDEDDYFLTQEYLRDLPGLKATLEWAGTYEQGLEMASENRFDVLLVDYRLGARTGLDLLAALRKAGSEVPVVVLTGRGDEKIAVRAMKAGAEDYLAKSSLDEQVLAITLRHAMDKVRTREALERQQAKYASLFSHSKEAIFILENDLLFSQLNPSFCELLGYKEENLLGKPLKTIIPDPDLAMKLGGDLMENGAIRLPRTLLRHQDGRDLPCALNAHRVLRGEEKLGFQGIIHDLSQLLMAEQDLRIAEKLSMTGRMARAIAHEVRNPLTNILLSVKQMESEAGDKLGDLAMYFGIVERNANRINDLISELMDSSKPYQLERESQDVQEVVEASLALCMDRIRLMNVDVEVHAPSEGLLAFLDREKIQIALLNVLTNAIEAMEGEEAPKMVLRIGQIPGFVEIRITDNGEGMSAESMERLFDPFFTGKKSGAGLGMTTAQAIVRSHRGKIQVESKLGKGTTFSFLLPE